MYLISPEKFENKEILAAEKMFEMGDFIFHLRTSLKNALSFLNKIPKKYHPKIVIHEHLELIEPYEVLGIHLKSEQRKKMSFEDLFAFCKKMKSQKKTISSAFHHLESLEKFAKIPFDYVFLSPVFDSISKPNYKGKKFDLKNFEKPFKIVGLGGITLKNKINVLKMNFDDVAILGAIWHTKNPVKSFSEWLQ